MPEQIDPPEPQQPPEQPTLLGSLAPDEMFARGMQSVKMTSGTSGTWQPPALEDIARLFPNYEILGLLGRGGMGAVYKAKQTMLDRLVAIKLLPLEISVDKDFADRFVREARAMAKLHHPNIITVFEFGKTSEGHLFFVMEYVEGANLYDIIHQVGLDGDQALSIVEQVCTALAYAHNKGIVHRDIKPANVMIDTESHVKVADFGLARLTDSSATDLGHTMTGTVMGTPDYMAPEQTVGMNVDHRADIYSLGVMLYEMVCRQVPKGIFQPPSKRTGCDTRIDEIVIKAMQQAPADRYQSTQEMKADVTTARSSVVVVSSPTQEVHPRPVARPGLPVSPKPLAMKAITPSAPKKSKLPLYALIIAAAAGAFFLFKPKPPLQERTRTTPNPLALATKEAPFENLLGMKFVPVPGTDILMCIHETRRKDYAAYCAEVPGTDNTWKAPVIEGKPLVQGDDHPVVQVSWEDATAFCKWLSKKEGRTYRLPTEREWNLAAVFDIKNPETIPDADLIEKLGHQFPWGTTNLADAPKYGNYDGSGDGYDGTAPVMSFLPNRLGIYDLGGNAWEWCDAWADAAHQKHVLRGCGYHNHGDPYIRSNNRQLCDLGFRAAPPNDFWRRVPGFRCVVERPATAGERVTDGNPVPTGGSATASKPEAATTDQPFVNTLGMKFVPVPILGGPTGGQRVLFSVWDTRVQDYEAFVKEMPREQGKVVFEQGPAHPVVNVCWADAQAFCAWLTQRDRKAGILGANDAYRLPTDHEWSCAVGIGEREDAAKLPSEKSAKIEDAFPWGTQWPPPQGAGNYASEELQPLLAAGKHSGGVGVLPGYRDGFAETSPVGSFAANKFGLFDMGGNVWQWCEDWYDTEQKLRVMRGASWYYGSRLDLLSSYRSRTEPAGRADALGFRCVLAAVSSTSAAATALVPAPSTTPATATKDAPFANTLGMKFVPAPIASGPTAGQRVLFSVWDTRVQDYAAYASAKKVDTAWTTANKDGVPVGRDLNHPVVSVSWEDAQAFCQWLTEKEITDGKLTKGLKYRLPTDEEWSWAVGLPPESGATPAERSQKNSVDFPWGRDYPPTKKVGNYADESFHQKFPKPDAKDPKVTNQWIAGYDDGYATTSPVGSFPANAYGLYDMGGNAWQWCEDWFDPSHKDRVLRGASWTDLDRHGLLSSSRHHYPPGPRNHAYGFRCVLAPGSTP